VTSLLLLEFRQSVRFQINLKSRDQTKGFSKREGEQVLADLETDLDSGALVTVPVEWVELCRQTEILSSKYTIKGGHRLLDIMHVATALYLEARDFLTFDLNQKRLAKAEGLKVPV